MGGEISKEKDLTTMIGNLTLNGNPLQTPRMHPVDWTDGEFFTESDDPDRMNICNYQWKQPKFISEKDPVSQREKLLVEEIDLESIGINTSASARWPYSSFAKVIHNILDPEECAELLSTINDKGFTPALLNVGSGRQMLERRGRDGHRAIIDSSEFTEYLFKILQPHLPSNVCIENNQGGMDIVEINERCRFLCYLPGQQFPAHRDGCFQRPAATGDIVDTKGGDMSRITVQFYLHDVPKEHGGATTFIGQGKDFPCQPKGGSALLFSQNLLHEGSLVKKGIKYTMRTEVMYRPRKNGCI